MAKKDEVVKPVSTISVVDADKYGRKEKKGSK